MNTSQKEMVERKGMVISSARSPSTPKMTAIHQVMTLG